MYCFPTNKIEWFCTQTAGSRNRNITLRVFIWNFLKALSLIPGSTMFLKEVSRGLIRVIIVGIYFEKYMLMNACEIGALLWTDVISILNHRLNCTTMSNRDISTLATGLVECQNIVYLRPRQHNQLSSILIFADVLLIFIIVYITSSQF